MLESVEQNAANGYLRLCWLWSTELASVTGPIEPGRDRETGDAGVRATSAPTHWRHDGVDDRLKRARDEPALLLFDACPHR